MHGTLSATDGMLVLGSAPRGLALRCLQRWEGGEVKALLAGVEIGAATLPALAPGAEFEIPVHRLPLVPLPAEIRIAASPEGPELAAPWRLESAAAAAVLLGPPQPVIADLRLDQGVLRGTLVEPANGLLHPLLYARVNGALARAVVADPPVPRPEGGCAIRFALALSPADLTEAGLSVDLHLAGREAPVAHYAWSRAGAGTAEAELARLQARLERLEQAMAAGQAALEAALQTRMGLQQERIDAFIEATATLLLDRLAGPGGAAADRRAALLGLIGTLAPVAAEPAPAGRRQDLGPRAEQFAAGWHAPEDAEDGSFRWMMEAGAVVNPFPERPVTAVLLHIRHLYRSPEPRLEAWLDMAPAQLAAMPSGSHGWLLRVTPQAPPSAFGLLRLESRASGSPARDGQSQDTRLLSIAVSRVTFLYEE
ncbi:hypothetical protein JYK14_16945 [Siccirubricoccus sp. KC 17139]|uniref:Uncharacterized protein n=1 Tax=Siccirubricoccus soli TaxID=2899147 RepID=A0ABT1D7C2_9PROT|nr:hypothetical protein [Siccirubricoccus soli]MCO6417837.1 hypothetical protein [Siccirubricoccus soli]MCP2683972.1 hypothetical protein [Siccirubricoccus soli]